MNTILKITSLAFVFAVVLCYLCKEYSFRKLIDSKDIQKLKLAFENANNIVITCHVSPDGDAIGSTLGLWHVLRQLGKHVVVITPDQCPKSLMFLSGISDIIPYSCSPEIATKKVESADLICCLDFNTLSRLDKMQLIIEKSSAYKVLIDHHLYPDNFADIKISYPEKSSTCYLLYLVLISLGYRDIISKDAAECIYTGMLTDTGNFTYNSTDPELYNVISDLIKIGIDKDKIYRIVSNTNSESRLRLCGYALSEKMKLYYNHKAALIVLDKNELSLYNYEKGDTEGLVNVPLSIPGIQYSAFLREDDEYIKISMRSVDSFPVNKVCETHFNGGGHLNAAGGEFFGSLNEAVSLFESILSLNDKYLE